MEKITYNTRVNPELIKEFKILAIRKGVRQSELLEEAIRDVLKKYDSKNPFKKTQPRP
jgi:metal-responsive CopG/Arc/MetJ family transcriptional regulator